MATRRVNFLRSSDNYVLAAVETNGHTYLKFLPSANGQNTQFDIIDAGQNRVRIQCVGTDKFWKLDRTDNWIQAEAVGIPTTDSLFVSAVDGLSYTAYQNVANGMYCKTFTQRPVQDCINASAAALTEAVKLILVDV
uniref:rRNA N-glycosidase n=1 Tax=Cannabis sativa TaxID=3483 RepID=A0A803PV64_CANSA